MKILVALLLLTSLVFAVRPPASLCRTVPIPEQLPVTIGEEMRFDLEDVFSGYNLYINSSEKSHITVTPKYEFKQFSYPSSYNLTVAKIKPWGRFWGLVINDAYSRLVGGRSSDSGGLTFQVDIHLQNRDDLHCFDVDEIFTPDGSLVVVDCASFFMGQVHFNEFLFYNTTSKTVVQSRHLQDTFVDYNYISRRKIEIIEDPFTRIPYLFRFHLRDGVSSTHKEQTYMEIFMMDNPTRPQILDVVDHTYFDMEKLSIVDYQVHNNLIYLLIYNKGVYQMMFTPDQHLVKRASFDMALDITRFRVDQLGFNDDLNLVMSNENTVYQFEWDTSMAPVLVTKYTLIPKSEVKQLFVDYNFVIVVADSVIDGQVTRRSWVFTKRTNSYLNAYNVFHAPTLHSPHIIVWNEHGSTLHIFHDQNAFFINMSLPYLHIAPVNESMINQTERYEVLATSIGDNGDYSTCSIQFKFLYLSQEDKRIIKTGYWPRSNLYVDSPDTREIPLAFEFFGANLTYNVSFDINSSIFPHAHINKEHQAVFNWPKEINPADIVYYQMFTEERTREDKPTAIYGLIQTGNVTADKTVYTTFYIKCKINVFDRDQKHTLDCQTVYTTRFSMGRILSTSQMYDPEERRVAIIFDSAPHTVYVYFFWPDGFGFYGRKDYAGDAGNKVTGVAISEGKLFVVLEYGKRVDIFLLEDLHETSDVPRNPNPKMSLTSQLMRFFGVRYFAPVSLKVSRFHKEAIFLKTKTGIMIFNINEDCLPELLFTVDTVNIMYDFEVNHDHLLVMTEQTSTLYDLDVPLRRRALPYKRQTIKQHFKLGQYDEVCSDKLFYIVGNNSAHVINPSYRSVSAYYSQVWAGSQIISVDAVNIRDREIFFLRTKTQILAYVFAENPMLSLEWTANSPDFKMSLSAYNPSAQSQPYTLGFEVLNSNETEIIPTEYFNETQVAKLGHLKSPKNQETYQGIVQINDTHWFDGNVLNYSFDCNTTECQQTTTIQNHVEYTRTVVEGRAIYDIESSGDGIYAQQYYSVFKTYNHNDSIHFINMIPTTRMGQVCTKMATGDNQQFLVSLCELGEEVNLYVTTLVANKPFTFGPYQTDAKAVNHARIEGSILMIVDNEDNPFVRSGGILLYHLNFDFDENQFITLLDYIDHEDLQIQGFKGTPYIGSADLHVPFWGINHEYRMFLTETRTGALFVFGFEVSPDGEQIIYLSKKYIPLEKIIPVEVKYPTPLRVQNIAIHFAFDDQNKTVEYYLLLSVTNWHHMELMITLDDQDQLLGAKLQRLFERFPWELQNYFKWKRGYGQPTYFAVPYVDYEESQQLVMVYEVPFIIRKDADRYEDKYSAHQYGLHAGLVPILRSFGAHPVSDVYETAFDFHTFGSDKLLWSDMSGTDIKELTLNKNVTLTIKGRTTPNDTILVTAYNPYTNFTFTIDVNFQKDKDDHDQAREILWIGIVAIGVFMILGILIVFFRQNRKASHHHLPPDLKETLITQDQRNQDNINRTSIDPGSIRGSIEPSLAPITAPAVVPPPQRKEEPSLTAVVPPPTGQEPQAGQRMVRERQESSSSSGDEVADLTH